MASPVLGRPSVSVAVVAICGAGHLRRCLKAIREQENEVSFDVVVAYDPHLDGIPAVAGDFPGTRAVANEGQRTPLELASLAIRESRGDLVLLTEDHCVPSPSWVQTMVDGMAGGIAVVGGRVETATDVSATDWAFYFVDFFRYAAPVADGPSPSLTVCNVAYRRAALDEFAGLWHERFHETAVNDALRLRHGSLQLRSGSEVRMRREVTLRDALYERYAFGRLFGCTRLEFTTRSRAWAYRALAPLLPGLLMGRMAAKALRSAALTRRFLPALPALVLMILSWSAGEWLGYLTGRHPSSLVAAPEIRSRQRAASREGARP